MQREFNVIDIYCDCCGIKIPKRDYFKNDGSYQKDSIKLLTYDVCKTCSMQILEKISKSFDDNINESIKSFFVKNRLDDSDIKYSWN